MIRLDTNLNTGRRSSAELSTLLMGFKQIYGKKTHHEYDLISFLE